MIPSVHSVAELTIFSGAVKLQKEREKAKKERKKEKKRAKKERSRGDSGKKEEKQHNYRKRKYEEFQSNNKTADYSKTREDEHAQLEKSSLTEEQGPAAVQNFCDSSDSTHNSSKRKKNDSAEISHSGDGIGGIGLRIRLPLLRHKDLGPPSASKQPCFSGRVDTVPAREEIRATAHQELPSSAEQPSFSGRIDASLGDELAKISHGKHPLVEAGRIRSSGCSCDSDVRRHYRNLVQNWDLPPLQLDGRECDDEDWLFGKTARRQHHGQAESEGEAASEGLDLGGALCCWPPRACYLPEAGIDALPFVVPF